jgi:hypothetical protein
MGNAPRSEAGFQRVKVLFAIFRSVIAKTACLWLSVQQREAHLTRFTNRAMEHIDTVLAVFPRLAAGYKDSAGYFMPEPNPHGYEVSVTCLLCNQPIQTEAQLSNHLKEQGHNASVDRFLKHFSKTKKLLERVKDLHSTRAEGVMARLEKLGCASWRNDVKGSLLSYVLSNANVQQETLVTVVTKLHDYEYAERLALIKLAVWKAECLKKMPAVGDDVVMADRWFTVGWKKYKTEQRNASAVVIVVSAVAPFLDPPEPYVVAL